MPSAHELDLGILILAGGEATRLPGKLFKNAGEVPMLVRVYDNVHAAGPTFISVKGALPAEIDERLPVPMVVDRWIMRGPLAGLISTMSEMPTKHVFAVAGDAPFLDAAFITALAQHYQDGDEAVIPTHHDGIEPLAAIYDRLAFIREGTPILLAGNGALRLVIEKLAHRFVTFDDPAHFANVNTPADYARIQKQLQKRTR